MKINLSNKNELTKIQISTINEVSKIIKGTWKESCTNFYLISKLKMENKLKVPSGIQPFINEVLHERFINQNWISEDSRFTKDKIWLRVTFRHQMSLGSDLLDAIKIIKLENINLCLVLAAKNDFLKIISPKDWRSLCSYEKLAHLHAQIEKIFNLPIVIGSVEPDDELSVETRKFIFGNRLQT